MRILILSSRMPHEHGKADSMTVYRILRHLAPRHEIHLACFYNGKGELGHVPELKKLCRQVQCVPLRKWKAALNMASVALNGDFPLQVAFYQDSRMRRVIDQMIDEVKPDLAYAHLIRMSEYLRRRVGLKKILAMQISQTLNYRRMIAHVPSLFHRALYKIEYRRVRRYEPAITRDFDSCLLISEYDKRSLDGHEHIHNVFYSPHGVDVERYTPSGEPVEKENAVLFCGVLETPTNMDAVLYFYRQIYPLVKQQVPDVRLYLAGKNPPRVIRRIAETDPSVVVTGFVKDIRPYYCRAKVGIDPLRIGAGLQNKLLIGMSMGQPMVCTSIANEGIAAKPDEHILVADEPTAFAHAVVELLTNDERAQTLARNARQYVEQKWTWEYYFQQLEAHFEKTASAH